MNYGKIWINFNTIFTYPLGSLIWFFSYFEVNPNINEITQPELLFFFFLILKDISFLSLLIISLLILLAFSILKSWSKIIFYIVLAGILFYSYQLFYITGQNALLNSFNYQIYSGKNCFYDDGFEKYIALDTKSKDIRLIPLNPEDNSFTPGTFIIRDISNVDCEFTTEKILLKKK